MKVISRRTIRAICKIPPEKLAEKKIITPARHGGYCCPMPDCSNGTGHDGTGITPTFNEKKNYWHWWCPKCGKNFNNLSVFKAHYKIDDFNELAESICADFDISPEYEEKDSPRFSRTRRTKTATNEEKISPEELKMIRADLATPIEPLKRFLQFGCDNNLWRGLPLEFLLKFNVRFVHFWTHPKSRIANNNATASPRMLIPCSDSSYLARLTCPLEEFDEQTRPFIHEKEHAGKKTIFNAADLDSGEIVFVVEGYVDALSVIYAGYRCVALGGAKEMAKLVDAVAKMPNKPRIIALLDSDDTGRKNAPILVDDLITVGCPAVARFLSEEISKLDCNRLLYEQGVDELREILAEIHDDAASELAAVAQVIEERKAARVAAKVDALFQIKGATDDDFADRLKFFCGDEFRWVKNDKSWLTFERNEYGGGMWHDGGEQNSAVLPFARKMADAMAEFAATADERELAEKFKSTKKKMQAITALKGDSDIIITSDDLNRHAELVNCLDCVINLQTGETLNAAPELYMTQTINATFRQPVKKENLDFVQNFFAQIMPDEMTRAGLIRWLAYCVSGETSAEKIAIWTGESGANGKGTLSKTLLSLFGEYGVGLPSRALLKTNRPVDADKATTALNGLDGRRFALSEELPLDGELDSSLVKTLTGGDRITLRRNFKEYTTLENFAKLNISGNYMPRLENTRDGGIRRRLLNMPFNVHFGTDENPADPTLKKKLLLPENLNALFAILVADAVNWYRDGLIISDLMARATEKHLNDSDFVADFIEENYKRGDGLSVKVKDFIDELKAAYPAECRAFRKRADLINLVGQAEGVTLDYDCHLKQKVFKGIGKPKPEQGELDGFGGEIVSSADFIPPPN